jgi:hypothetical protein
MQRSKDGKDNEEKGRTRLAEALLMYLFQISMRKIR